MKTDEIIKDIHDKVTEIRVHQASQTEKISDLEEYKEKHDTRITKIEAGQNKLVGAGIFVTFAATIVKFWEGIFG